MLYSYSSNAIFTKIRAIFGKRLTAADYSQMARKTMVGEVAALLKENSSYREALKTLSEVDVHRGQLESMLKKDLFYQYIALKRYDFSDNRFYDFMVTRLEIEEILRCVLHLSIGEMEGFIVDAPGYLIHHATFPILQLATVRRWEDLLALLAHTPYRAVLKDSGIMPDQIDYRRCEHVMYLYYYDYLLGLIDRHFRGKTREALRELILTEIEMKNIQFIFRLKLFYQMKPDEIRSLLYPYRHKLTKSQLEQMLQADSETVMTQVMEQVHKRPVGDGYIERHTRKYLADYGEKQLRFTTKAPVAMYAFILLREVEVGNIITIIEGIRYRLPQQEIEQLLILT